jgi:hypothetical protein
MKVRTIQPAFGPSSVTPEQARAAAHRVYRDAKTGRFIIEGPNGVEGSFSDLTERALSRMPSVRIVQNRRRTTKQQHAKRESAKKR